MKSFVCAASVARCTLHVERKIRFTIEPKLCKFLRVAHRSQVWSRQKVAEAALMPFKTYRKSNWKFLMCTVTQLALPLCSCCCFSCCTQLFCCCCCCTDKLQLTLSAFYATLRAASQPESEINVWKVKCISACVQGTVTHAHTYYVCMYMYKYNKYLCACVCACNWSWKSSAHREYKCM